MKVPRVSSALKAVDLKQEPAPLIIGERLNTQGSRKAKEMVLKDDLDGLVNLAREQVEDGAHCLDVCVATTERSDELEFMKKLVKRLSLEVEAPLVIDSTDPKVVEAAVMQIPGRPIINSINLEGDGSRFSALAPIMARYGLPAIAMCIGPKGMAKTAEEKVETAQLLYDTGSKKYGLAPWQFIFDVLTFTLATGEAEYADSAKNTLEGIRLVKQRFPGAFTTLGLSNVSFGLPAGARKIVNSVFLYHAIKAGLDTVIINARDVIPYPEIDVEQKRLAEDLIFNKHQNALSDLIAYFEGERAKVASGTGGKRVEVDPSWDADRKCHFRIVNRLKDGIEADVVQAIAGRIPGAKVVDGKIAAEAKREAAHEAAVQTLNEVLLPAMKEVGDKFGAGELILPFVLKSAECMKAAVAELEKYLIKQEGVSKGKLVLCTVYGDVHDIGKNLVKTIFTNNGYTVYDLGKQVPMQKILEKIEEVRPDAVGLSALLVSTSKQMQYFVEHARQNGMEVPVLCGGAAINSNYINRIAKDGGIYSPGVFYCKTAFDGLRAMNALVSKEERAQFVGDWRQRLEKWTEREAAAEAAADLPHSGIKPVEPPVAPHLNRQVRLEPADLDLREIWKHISKKSLFVLQWGIRGKGASESGDPEKLFAEWTGRVLDDRLFEPRAVYGYFRCHNLTQGKGGPGRLAVDYANDSSRQAVFEFPRSAKEKHLCLADYFGQDDVAAFQAVTVGTKVTEVIDRWNKQDRYSDAYYLHGLAVETAEAMAEWVNARIRKELGIGDRRGLRYSWGYPSCPDVMQHHLVWQILDPAKSGMGLTESGQIVPDQSTAAIVVHHPQAEYFVL
ncbi:methionine synthase [Nitrososphaera viennensis]|uniref:Dihydropteroate synthase n=1 Tax=Nitrososphaera viennensis TaxID=1034015 RepID=A0A977NLW3_9ARCH|nr:dihydropteroate synthase [Nitrososphaera viennensis]UVS68766.1 dihydropteroate synthase [Nitrososphaera viennensis]